MLRKLSRTVVIPGVAAVTARPASTVCVPALPPPGDPAAPTAPPSGNGNAPLKAGDVIYVYVPRYFSLFTNEETRTQAVYPAPAGYTCVRGTYVVGSGLNSEAVYETRCYWNYP